MGCLIGMLSFAKSKAFPLFDLAEKVKISTERLDLKRLKALIVNNIASNNSCLWQTVEMSTLRKLVIEPMFAITGCVFGKSGRKLSLRCQLFLKSNVKQASVQTLRCI